MKFNQLIRETWHFLLHFWHKYKVNVFLRNGPLSKLTSMLLDYRLIFYRTLIVLCVKSIPDTSWKLRFNWPSVNGNGLAATKVDTVCVIIVTVVGVIMTVTNIRISAIINLVPTGAEAKSDKVPNNFASLFVIFFRAPLVTTVAERTFTVTCPRELLASEFNVVSIYAKIFFL